MIRSSLLLLALLLSGCASFDRTDIKPGQRVYGLGFSFTVPTQTPWFAVEYGTSHRMKLTQLNYQDSYSILASITRGPARGMYKDAESYLNVIQRHQKRKVNPAGFDLLSHKEEVNTRYGELCVRYSHSGKDWAGRNNEGPALVDSITLSCSHPEMKNILVSVEISRRYETNSEEVDLELYADTLFSSIEYNEID